MSVEIERVDLSPKVSEPADLSRELSSEAPTLRPQLFEDYPGQERVKQNLKVYVEAAKKRKRTLDHTIFTALRA